MQVTKIDNKLAEINVAPHSVHRLSNNWISSFAMYEHDENGHAHFDVYHLAILNMPDSVYELAMGEVEHAFDDLFNHRIQDHPYLTSGKAVAGYGLGGYDAAKAANHAKYHPSEYKKMIFRASARQSLKWILVPYLPFFIGKHVGHLMRDYIAQNKYHEKMVYIKSNSLDGKYFAGAPWR